MYVLINVYAPNKDTNVVTFLNNLLTTLQKNNFDEEENIIIGGDFNCPPNPILDKKEGLLNPRKSVVTTIENLQEELDLVDIWKVKNPERKSFTWNQNSPMIFRPLNYWLISNTLHRSHTIQRSKRRARERKEREQNLQEEYAKAKFIFETDPNDRNANILISAKETLELFYEEKVKGIIIRA